MNYRDLMNKEFKRSNNKMKITKLPKNKRITAKSLRVLEQKVSSQISVNDLMRSRSMNVRTNYVCPCISIMKI